MKYFIVCTILTIFCNCSVSSKQANPSIEPFVQKVMRNYDRENEIAWRDAENDRIVSFLEILNETYWIMNSTKKVILFSVDFLPVDSQWKLDHHIGYSKKFSIFNDGILFVDNEKRKISLNHQKRLKDLYNKIIKLK